MKRPAQRNTTPVLGFGLFGLGAEFTDPAAVTFANRVRDELGVEISNSPYRYYQTDEIIQRINCTTDTTILLWGTSLGGNNVTVIASQCDKPIAGAFVFQASQFGAKNTITPNVQFFHNIFNPFIALGSYKPQLAEGNSTTIPVWSERWVPHPGDQDEISQDMFLADMARIIA